MQVFHTYQSQGGHMSPVYRDGNHRQRVFLHTLRRLKRAMRQIANLRFFRGIPASNRLAHLPGGMGGGKEYKSYFVYVHITIC